MSDHTKSNGAGGPQATRRGFLKILGAGTATAAAVGCGTDRVEKLVPYLVHPDNTIPGESNYYATVCRECSVGCGVIAEVRDGRAIKLEGNPAHPISRGALCARGQSALQGLYNPDRWRGPMVRQGDELVPTTWQDALQRLGQAMTNIRAEGRAGGAVFVNQHETGSFPAFLDQWLASFGAPAHLSYDALHDGAAAAANRAAYGVSFPGLDFTAARLIVSFSADFLDGWGAMVPQQLSWADARARLQGAPRLVYVGPRRSLTGLNADEWIPCLPGGELAIAQALQGGGDLQQAAQQSGAPLAKLQSLSAAMRAGPSMVLAGGSAANAYDLATTVNALNQSLGNVGRSILPAQPLAAAEGVSTAAEMHGLAERMRGGQVSALFVRGANPVFTLPAAMQFGQAMAQVPLKVSFSSYPDETSVLCDLIIPDHHPLESWGDAPAEAGSVALQQPTMDPVFSTRATPDVLLSVVRADAQASAQFPEGNYRSWLISRYPGGQNAFAQALATGLGSGSVATRPAAQRPALPVPAAVPAEQTQGDFHLLLYASSTMGDGSGANKPWLQELPDPVSKIAWQSWVEINPATAQRLGIDRGDVVRVQTAQGSVELTTYLYPGIQPDTVAVMLGRGHTHYGRFAENVGVNPLVLLPVGYDARTGAMPLAATRCSITRTGGFVPLVTTEGSARQHGRGIAQAVQVNRLRGTMVPATGAEAEPRDIPPYQGGAGEHGADPYEDGAVHHDIPGAAPHEFLPGMRAPTADAAEGALGDNELRRNRKEQGMYAPDHWGNMAQRRWAMTIDLARCTGCSACVTACYAENNIPTVGAAYQARNTPGTVGMPGGNILRGREMAWIRLERYYEGTLDGGSDFEARFVPMLCQHCGNAPCEPVCPVYATYHAPDGLNVQVYNRCVGTRYCSNNCPYKVRYFNWFGYGEKRRPQYAWPEPMNWQLNPDVTVRGKGVMEKCTFCVQRIREAEHVAKGEGRALRADEFTVACAQACPSRAITFGDAADPEWSVNRLIRDERAYHVFEELNAYTAVVYLKKVNHPASAAPAAAPQPA